jgi:outer membrane protein assembly factor BamB
MRLILILLVSVFFMNCRKEMIPVDPCACAGCCDTPETPIKLLWNQPLGPDTLEYASMRPVVFQDKVLFSLLFYLDNQDFLKMRSINDGRLLWEWEPYIEPGILGLGIQNNDAKDNIYVGTTWSEIYGINMMNGSNLWGTKLKTDVGLGMPRLKRVGDYFYHTHNDQSLACDNSYLARAPFTTGVFDTVFHLQIENGYSPHIETPELWVNGVGDSVLIFQNRQWNFPASDGKIDLYAFNLKTRQVDWKIDDIDPEGNSNVYAPLVYKDKVYFQGTKTCFCINAQTGKIIWKKRIKEYDHLLSSNLLIAEGMLFLKPSNEAVLYALNPDTGQEIYQTPDCGTSECVMVYYKGVIYYGSDGKAKIYAIRASDGTILWSFKTPNTKIRANANFKQIAIDEHSCKLFVTDNYFATCFQLP